MAIPYQTANLNPPIFLQGQFRAQPPNLIPANISGYAVCMLTRSYILHTHEQVLSVLQEYGTHVYVGMRKRKHKR